MALPGIAFSATACGLLLLLWAREATQALGLGILPLHDFDCSQPGVECTAREVNAPPLSWFKSKKWNPMPPQRMNVRPALLTDPSCPNPQAVLNITWQVATDASILHLEGAEVCVLRYQGSHSMCVRYTFSPFTSSRSTSGRPWEFYFDRFEAEPNMHYLVHIYSLPMVMAGQDDLHIKAEVVIPDCRNKEMMLTRNCIKTGSLWQPRVQTSFCENKLMVNFTTSNIFSEKYRVIVRPEQGCGNHRRLKQHINMTKEDRTSVTSGLDKGLLQECSILSIVTKEDRKLVIFDLDKDFQDCSNFSVEIIPFFEACKNDCTRKLVNATRPCSEKAQGLTQKLRLEGASSPKIIILAGVAVFLLCLLLITIILLKNKVRKNPEKPTDEPKLLDEVHVTERKKILLLYSTDHALYEEVICCLASYLQNHCGFEVILDQSEKQQIAMTGHMNWLQARKTEIEMNPGNKIMVVCSRGVMVKWRRAMGQKEQTSRIHDDSIIGDMFTPALGYIANDFKDPVTATEKYIVTYFEGFDSTDSVPGVLGMAMQYELMTNMRELWFRIYGTELRGPGVERRVSGISADDYHTTITGRRLYDAINKFKMFQKSNPTWFERLHEIPAEYVVPKREEVEIDDAVQRSLQVNFPEFCFYERKINPTMPKHTMQTQLVNQCSPSNDVIHCHTREPSALAQSDSVSRHFVDQWPTDRGHQNYSNLEYQHILASNRESSVEARPRSEGYHSSSSNNGHCATSLTTDASHDIPVLEHIISSTGPQKFDENAVLLDHAGRKVGCPFVDNKDSGIKEESNGDVESSGVSDSMMKLLHEFQRLTLRI